MTRRSGSRFFGLAVAASFAATAPAFASESKIEIGGVQFAPRIPAESGPLELHGAGVLRYQGVIRAYAAALYLEAGTPGETVLHDVPKRLELEYFWSIDAEDFGRAADGLLARSLSPDQLAPLRDRLAQLHARYEDVVPGDRYALTYFPGVGTELSKNGRPLAVVAGSDFAAAYFSMWLGEDPIDSKLRNALRSRLSERARN